MSKKKYKVPAIIAFVVIGLAVTIILFVFDNKKIEPPPNLIKDAEHDVLNAFKDAVKNHTCTQKCFYTNGTPEDMLLDYTYNNVYLVSHEALFGVCGNLNKPLLKTLFEFLDQPLLDPHNRELSFNQDGAGFLCVTAADFSELTMQQMDNPSQTVTFVMKLFPFLDNRFGVENSYLSEFTSQWWQLVFRSDTEGGGKDTLTLWMMQPYRTAHFAGTRYEYSAIKDNERYMDAEGAWHSLSEMTNTIKNDKEIVLEDSASNQFFFENNYVASIARYNLLLDYATLTNWFNPAPYVVTPEQLPGLWQSSDLQTGSDVAGATNLLNGRLSLMNGMDGKSVGPWYTRWRHTYPVSFYNDVIWLPSAFEIGSIGTDLEVAETLTVLQDYTNPETGIVDSEEQAATRSGLWRLNGFDRAFVQTDIGSAWLRSAPADAIGNADIVSHIGDIDELGVNQAVGLRPAISLSLTKLREQLND